MKSLGGGGTVSLKTWLPKVKHMHHKFLEWIFDVPEELLNFAWTELTSLFHKQVLIQL